jgi:hypothetical protein
MNNDLHPAKFSSFAEYEAAFTAAVLAQAKTEAANNWQKTEKHRELAGLHSKLGFNSVAELITALTGLLPDKAKRAGKKADGAVRKRATITDEIRASVKRLAAEGKKAPFIAKELGISAPTVYNILKA